MTKNNSLNTYIYIYVSFWIKLPQIQTTKKILIPFQNTYQLISSFPNAPFHKPQRTEETPPVKQQLGDFPHLLLLAEHLLVRRFGCSRVPGVYLSPAWHGGTSAKAPRNCEPLKATGVKEEPREPTQKRPVNRFIQEVKIKQFFGWVPLRGHLGCTWL